MHQTPRCSSNSVVVVMAGRPATVDRIHGYLDAAGAVNADIEEELKIKSMFQGLHNGSGPCQRDQSSSGFLCCLLVVVAYRMPML